MKRKSVSLFLTLTLILTSVGIPVYSEKLPSDFDTQISANTDSDDNISVSDNNESQNSISTQATGDNVEFTVFDATDKTAALTAGNLIIDADGEYSISDYTGTNTITVSTGVTAELTIQNVEITATSATPIKVESGAHLKLHVKGTGDNANSFTASSNYYAGISVYADNTQTSFGILEIDGDGELTAKGALHAPGIGTNKKGTDSSTGINGRIIINGATITATGGTGGAGIGNAYYGSSVACGDIEINSGHITATAGKQAAAIGGSGAANPNGKITINGGYIKTSSNIAHGIGYGNGGSVPEAASIGKVEINGGSVDSVIGELCAVENSAGEELQKVEFTIRGGTSFANKVVSVNSWSSETDANGKLYFYLPESAKDQGIAIQCENHIYYTDSVSFLDPSDPEFDPDNDNVLDLYNGDPCSCDETTSSVEFDLPDTITVNKLQGLKSEMVNLKLNRAAGCEYPLHPVRGTYQITIDGQPATSDMAVLSDNYLTVYYAAAGKTITISSNDVTMDKGTGTVISYPAVSKDIEIIGDESSLIDLAQGNITVASSGSDLKITHGSSTYTVPSSTLIQIYQSNNRLTTDHTIDIQTSANVSIENLNIYTIGTQKTPIHIGNNASVNLTLNGSSTIMSTANIAVYGSGSGTYLTIDGEGSLDVSSGGSAAVGKIDTLTINGGTLKATGGGGGAGIGGDMDGAGFNVVVNDGYVEATGDQNAAGIGGGTSGKAGGNFTINGGTVKASSPGTGSTTPHYGIGPGGQDSNPGTLTYNGGSLFATYPGGTTGGISPYRSTLKTGLVDNRQFPVNVSLEGVTGKNKIEYVIGDDDNNKIPATTDENGQLCLYLKTGNQWIRVYKDGNIYYKYIRVNGSPTANSDITCILHPDVEITNFVIQGQTQDTVIDNNNPRTITAYVPYNIILSNISPTIEYKGASINDTIVNTPMNFDNSTHSLTLTLYGDDKTEAEYTINLVLQDEPSETGQDVFDISKGNIAIQSDRVLYGRTAYRINPLGYVIKGTSDENFILIDDYTNENDVKITFKDLNVSSASASNPPFKANSKAQITVEGTCNFTSLTGNAAVIANLYSKNQSVSIIGDGKLNLQGGTGQSAVSVANGTTLSITGPATSILGGTGTNGLSGNGTFITDSVHPMKISYTSSPELIPQDAEGHALYQLEGAIDATDKSKVICTYNGNNSFYVFDDATIYLMVPDGTYSLTAVYDGKTYQNIENAVINGAAAQTTLYTVRVDGVTYPTEIDSAGGNVDFTVTGTLVSGNVKIRIKSNNSNKEKFPDAEATVTAVGNVNKATIELPVNESYETQVIYTVYYVIGEGASEEETELTDKIVLDKDLSVKEITEYTLDHQVGDTKYPESGVSNIISIYMPYDQEFPEHEYFTPKTLKFIGNRIYPEANTPAYFTRDTSGYMRATYTVFANDDTSAAYSVRLYKSSTPQIRSLSYTSISSPNGGYTTVTARGESTNSIRYALNEKNRKVYIYVDDDVANAVEAELRTENGVDIYVADRIFIPANPSSNEEATHTLHAKIGDVVQTAVNTVSVPRQERAETGIKSFMLPDQVGNTEITAGTVFNITMPYDADITSLAPQITLEDPYASISPSPTEERDFTNDVNYTVTSENGLISTVYTVKVTKQEVPVIHSLQFESSMASSAGLLQVILDGEFLENAENAIVNDKTIQIFATPEGSTGSGTVISAVAKLSSLEDETSGKFIANLNIPSNTTDQIKRYTLSAKIGDIDQTLTGNKLLTVAAKETNSKNLSSIYIAEGQGAMKKSENTNPVGPNGHYNVYITVPYNTDLGAVEAVVNHDGDKGINPASGTVQNFNNPVTYRVTAEDDTYNDFTVNVQRGTPAVTAYTLNQPESYKKSSATIDMTGKFIPYLIKGDVSSANVKDSIAISAIPRDGSETINGTVTYDDDVYGGHAIGTFNLPENNTSENQYYDVIVTLNGSTQQLGSIVIKVPRKTARTITSFIVNGQARNAVITEDDEQGNTILFTMPYNTDLRSILPRIRIDGDSYTPTEAQDFEGKSVTYTVSAKDDTDRNYKVSAARDGLPTISSVKISNTPDTFKGKTVNVDVEGIFFYNMRIEAVPVDGGNAIEGDVDTDNWQWNKASATIDIPDNESTENEKIYELRIYLDDFEEPIVYTPLSRIVVPRRKTRAITGFTISNQRGVARITDTDVYVNVSYETNVRELTAKPTIDGDSYTPTGTLNFNNDDMALDFYISAQDDVDRKYTVHVSRDGKPSISALTYVDPVNYHGGAVNVNFEGIFFKQELSSVSAVPLDGGAAIPGTITSFEEGRARAVVTLPENTDTKQSKKYRLRFVLDGFVTEYTGGTEITVPRCTEHSITSFTLPGVQEEGSDTVIDGTNIYVDVPYNADISSVVPEIEFDADTITPAAEIAQDFSNPDHPVTYTLSSSGDEDVTYTVHINRVGNDPYLKSMTVEGQTKDTEYDGDNITIQVKSGVKIKEIEPVLTYDGSDYSPKGAQDFSKSKNNPIEYTIVNKYGIEHKYYVTIIQKSSGGGSSSSSSSVPTPTPTATPEPTDEPEPTITPQPSNPDATTTPVPTVAPSGNIPYISGYEEDGQLLFKPYNTITRAEVARILSVLDDEYDDNVIYTGIFADVFDSDWFSNYINFAAEKGYISGYEDGTCRPNNMITRAEFVSMLSRFADVEIMDSSVEWFDDLDGYEWCENEINTFADKGIVSGYDDGTFRPGNNITRSEAVTMINRLLGRTIDDDVLATLINQFADVSEDDWAYSNILIASSEF